MKKLVVAVVVSLFALSGGVFAASIDGTYKFSNRTKEGKPDMQGWTGTMTILGAELSRAYKSADGTQEKFYTSTLKHEGDVFVLTHTKAYKPEYVGNTHRNKIVVKGTTLIFESEDGKFTETWNKK